MSDQSVKEYARVALAQSSKAKMFWVWIVGIALAVLITAAVELTWCNTFHFSD